VSGGGVGPRRVLPRFLRAQHLDRRVAPKSKFLPAAANDFIAGYAINWGPVFASGVLIVLPVALAALLLQRYIVRGLTLGAFK